MDNNGQKKRTRARPNLIFMILAMVAVTGLQMAFGKQETLPIATGVVGSLGTLGLALLKPEEEPEQKEDPIVQIPASSLKDVSSASSHAYERGFRDGLDFKPVGRPQRE